MHATARTTHDVDIVEGRTTDPVCGMTVPSAATEHRYDH